jgi:anaerobic selenocysteine-containing dehydrogenase
VSTIENGRAVEVAGDPLHPTTRGTLCTKVARYLDRTYSDQRVLHPLRRVGRKGEGKFERISWDEALTAIAARFKGHSGVDRWATGDPAVQLRGHHGPAAIRVDGSTLLSQARRIAA